MNTDTSDEHNPPVAFIATPLYGGVGFETFFDSVLMARQRLGEIGITSIHQTLRNESLVTRARMTLVADFMARPECTHLIFVDGDISFAPDTFERLLSHRVEVVCGAYPLKSYPISYVMSVADTERAYMSAAGTPLIDLSEAGTGMMCIHRSVFEKMKDHYPELQCRVMDSRLNQYGEDARKRVEEEYWAFFDTMLVDPDDKGRHRYLSEDYAFCRRWRETGGRVLLDPSIKLDHTGTHTFRGDVSTLINNLNMKEDDSNE